MSGENKITLAVVDDHELFRSGISTLVESLSPDFVVVNESGNGKIFLNTVGRNFPEIILLDVNMPVMSGFEVAAWINQNKPDVKILVISMIDDHSSIMKMMAYGVNGFLNKDAEPEELKKAIIAIHEEDYYFNSKFTEKMMTTALANSSSRSAKPFISLSENEKKFVELSCTELTYKEIAETLGVTAKAVDKQREALFNKLAVKTRTGLAIKALKFGFVKM